MKKVSKLKRASVWVVIDTFDPSNYYIFKTRENAEIFEASKPFGRFEIEVKRVL